VEIDFLSRTVTNTTPRPILALEMGDPLGESVAGFVAAAKAGVDALVTPEQAAQALETALLIEDATGISLPIKAAQPRIAAVR
jgi:outer membrane biogenesis lipoprotein LolB